MESTEVRCNRIGVRLVCKEEKRIVLLEMSCPWISNRDLKDKEKALKYAQQAVTRVQCTATQYCG